MTRAADPPTTPLSWSALLPRNGALLVALAGIAWALTFTVSNEAPVGKVTGKVLLEDARRPLDGAEVFLQAVGARGRRLRVRYAVTGPDGSFVFSRVPAGTYYVSATSHAHAAKGEKFSVDEGKASERLLLLKRSRPELALRQHQRIFGTREAAHLAISGYVDPLKPARHDTVRLSLYQTRLSTLLQDPRAFKALETVGRSYDPAKRLPDALRNPTEAPAPAALRHQEIRLTQADKEGFYYQKLPLGTLKSGFYLMEIAHAAQTVCAWVMVTDTALIVKHAKGRILNYVVDMETGKPVQNAQVLAYQAGKVVGAARTDARGLAELGGEPSNGLDGTARKRRGTTEVALRGADEAVVARTFYANEGSERTVTQIDTDRPIYRPGQRISFKGIVRYEAPAPQTTALGANPGDPAARYTVAAGKSVDAELRDPSGERVFRTHCTTGRYGSFNGTLTLDAEARTGVYILNARIEGTEHTHEIVVASYKKPEFTVTVSPERMRYLPGEEVTARIAAQFYFGTPVSGARARYAVFRSPVWTSDGAEEDGSEGEPMSLHPAGLTTRDYGSEVANGETTLDAEGHADVHFRTRPQDSSEETQEQTYRITVTITDSANRESEGGAVVNTTPGDFRLTVAPQGYLAAPGQPTSVSVTAKNFDGSPVPNLPVTLETLYEHWKHGKSRRTPAGTFSGVTGSDGRAIVPLTPTGAGELMLKAHASDARGHRIAAASMLWVAGDGGADLDTEYPDLALLTDRRQYAPGNTARVVLNAAHTGQTALLTLEGDQVYHAWTVPVVQRSTVVYVPIHAGYGPNIFLSACYVRSKHFATTMTPLRVTLPQQQVRISIVPDPPKNPVRTASTAGQLTSMPRFHPADPITYHIRTTDEQGRPLPCELSFGVVDEAIYALREDVPNALQDAFYPRRFNRVQTNYSFEAVYLGDADKAEPKINARKRFPDTAYWRPAVETDPEGRAEVTFNLPDSLTTWRATVKAHSLQTQVGYAVNKVVTVKEFFVRLETPRFLTQNDRSEIVAVVHNETSATRTALVRMHAQNLMVAGDTSRTLSVESGKTARIVWQVTAGSPLPARLKVTAWTPEAAGGTQWTDGVETVLTVRPHVRERIQTFAGMLRDEQTETEVIHLDRNAVPSESRLTVRIAPSLSSTLLGSLDYLIGYPYGCTEQTMSRFLPDLLVQRALRNRRSAAPKQAAELPKMVQTGLLRLYRLQHPATGGWGWWEHDPDDPWMTAYVLWGLSTARAEGYEVSGSVIGKGREAARKMLRTVAIPHKPFLLYALALTGAAAEARAARATLDRSRIPAEGLALLVLMARRLGDSPEPELTWLDKKAVSEGELTYWKTGPKSQWRDEEATAVALRALVAARPGDPRLVTVLRYLLLKRAGSHWSSTRSTAWVLSALADYVGIFPEQETQGRIDIAVNGQVAHSYTLTPELAHEQELVARVPATALRADKNDITLRRTGGQGRVFYTVEFRQGVAGEDLAAAERPDLQVTRAYDRIRPARAGEDTWTLQAEPTGNLLRVGDRIRVRLRVHTRRELSYVLIEDPFPAGCEPLAQGSADEDVSEWSYSWSSIDIRDDRVAFFARNLSPGVHVFEYNLRVQTPGTYHALPVLVQPMYAPEIKAEGAETRVEVQ